MKCVMLILTVLLSFLAVEDTKADSQVAVASGPVTVCLAAAPTPGDIVSECEKRDVARLSVKSLITSRASHRTRHLHLRLSVCMSDRLALVLDPVSKI